MADIQTALAEIVAAIGALARGHEEIHETLGQLVSMHADVEARIERIFRKGKVTDVDPANHLYRQEIGLDDEGASVKSPWLPYSQVAGGRKAHSMPSIGEQYLLINPDGSQDFTQGLGVPHGWYSANPSPSTDPNADVTTRGTTTDVTTATSRTLQVGSSSLTMVDGSITLKTGGSTLVVTGSSITQTSDKIVTEGETHLGSAAGVPAAQLGTIDTAGNADEVNLATKVYVT